MKTCQTCIPCIMKLFTSTLEKVTLPQDQKADFMVRFEAYLKEVDMSLPPARSVGMIYQQVLQETGLKDLFEAQKTRGVQEALLLYPRLKGIVDRSSDKLEAALRVSALGNILDAGNPNSYDLEEEIGRLFAAPLSGGSLDLFKDSLDNSPALLYLADNAGETVFDRVLIETLDLPVRYAVKSAPALDDALLEDARQAGLEELTGLLETGTSYPGTYLPSCSPEFQEIFRDADLILAKGQANYETLSDVNRDLFFLLKIKCEVIGDDIGLPVGSLTLKFHSG
ncbi:MAG: hypothetical protein DRI46_13395 [Chloroflexi bacterium]|nr:MAG: hypothetical protein DRI46_13395 [Chloroflexota bacterium]